MLQTHYDFSPGLVVLSYGISFLGAYVAISLCEQLRQSMVDDKLIYGSKASISHRKKHLLFLFLMSLSISGIGIWSIHFIGMHALMVRDNNGNMVSMKYNVPLSVVSFICVLFTTFVGMTTASYDVMFSKNKQEILEQLISDTKKLSMNEIKKIDYKKMLIIISTKRLWRLVLGGLITGGGVSIMHYIGMAAMVFDGHIVWNPAIVFVSVVVAIVASIAAFWILFRLLSIFPELEYLRLASALIMGIAVCGMHYTGMTAASYSIHTDGAITSVTNKDSMNNQQSYEGALIGANLMLWLIAIYMIWNYRREGQKLSKLLHHADQIAHYITVESPRNSSVVPSSIGGGGGHSPGTGELSAHSASSAAQIRIISEQYLAKRYRSHVSSRKKRQVHSWEPSPSTQANLPATSSFSAFIGYALYWLFTGRWRTLAYVCCSDNDLSQSSVHDIESGRNDSSGVHSRSDFPSHHVHGRAAGTNKYGNHGKGHYNNNSNSGHPTASSTLIAEGNSGDFLKPVMEVEHECLSNAHSQKLPLNQSDDAFTQSSTTLCISEASNKLHQPILPSDNLPVNLYSTHIQDADSAGERVFSVESIAEHSRVQRYDSTRSSLVCSDA